MTHDIKHWVLQIPGLGQYLTFESCTLHMGNREAYALSAANLTLTAATNGALVSAIPVAPENPETVVGSYCRVLRRTPDGTLMPFWTGTVTGFSLVREGGSIVGNQLSAAGAWHWLERLVYTQPASYFYGSDSSCSTRQTSRIVLGQSPDGSMIGSRQQIYNLESFVSTAAGESGPVPDSFNDALPAAFDAFQLPFDEMRDATVAQCLDRILRYIPGVVVAQRTGAERRKIDIFTPDSAMAPAASGYMDAAKILQRTDSADDSAIAGVRVQIDIVDSVDGRAVHRMQEQLAPSDGTPGPGWMYVTLQLSGRDASRTIQRLDMQTEDFPEDLNDDSWWTGRLGNTTLKNVVGLEITEAARSGSGDHPEWYPRIALNAAPVEIAEAGLKSRVEKITCLASYTLQDDAGNLLRIVEGKPLEIEVVATNAQTREYTWTSSYSVTEAEPIPAGLAQAILDQHASAGRSVSALIRLPISGDIGGDIYLDPEISHEGLPGPGDVYDGLVCQTADYDLVAHTVRVAFGPPSHVSPQDLASLMIGSRTRKSCSVTPAVLSTGEADGSKVDTTIAAGGGSKNAGTGKITREVIRKTGTGSQNAIDLDPAKITGATPASMEPREITVLVPTASGIQAMKIQIMATSPENVGSPVAAKGRVVYDQSGTPAFRQYRYDWNNTTGYAEAGPDLVTELESHASQHIPES